MQETIRNIVVGSIATNCWIYPLEKAGQASQLDGLSPCAVIDPGEEGDRIVAFLDQLSLFPAHILLTHGHFDHLAAAPALVREYQRRGARPQVAIHAADAQYLGPGAYDAHCRVFYAAGGPSAYIDALWEDMPPPDRNLAEGDAAGPFTVLHLPGHTPGSIAFWDKKAGALFSGDTLFRGGCGRTDLPGGSEALLSASLKRLLALDGGIKVYPGHGAATSIAAEAS